MPTMNTLRLVALSALLVGAVGCVQRTISITSDPNGALVYLNDKEVGRTPLEVPFKFYGVYDVRLERDGYKPLWTEQQAEAPFWEAPGPDLIAEAIPGNKVQLQWHFTMEQQVFTEETDLIDRARDMQGQIGGAADEADAPQAQAASE
jgi:hypothetical protein